MNSKPGREYNQPLRSTLGQIGFETGHGVKNYFVLISSNPWPDDKNCPENLIVALVFPLNRELTVKNTSKHK